VRFAVLPQAHDERAIRRQIELYAHSADRRQPAVTAGVFAEGGVLQIYTGDPNEGGTLDRERIGRDEIETAMGGLARYRATLHVLGQSTIDVHGSEAESETYCTAHHLTDHDDGAVTDRFMAIRYLDDWIRTAEGWRLRRRRLAVDWIDTRRVDHPTD
jgi:hypothetical protein